MRSAGCTMPTGGASTGAFTKNSSTCSPRMQRSPSTVAGSSAGQGHTPPVRRSSRPGRGRRQERAPARLPARPDPGAGPHRGGAGSPVRPGSIPLPHPRGGSTGLSVLDDGHGAPARAGNRGVVGRRRVRQHLLEERRRLEDLEARLPPMWQADYALGWSQARPGDVAPFSRTYPEDPTGPDALIVESDRHRPRHACGDLPLPASRHTRSLGGMTGGSHETPTACRDRAGHRMLLAAGAGRNPGRDGPGR